MNWYRCCSFTSTRTERIKLIFVGGLPILYFTIILDNCTAQNVVNNSYLSIYVSGNSFVESSFSSIHLRNVSTQTALIISRVTRLWIAKDIYFENSTASLQYLISLTQTNNITVSNLTLNDVRGMNTDAYSLVYLQTYSGGFITVDGFNVFNSHVNKHKSIYADTYGSNVRGNFALTNWVFKNVTMASGDDKGEKSIK